jgi:hypothetical protein
LIRAGCQALRGNSDQTEQLLVTAIDQFQTVDMHLFAASARRRLGQLRGGDEGRALVEQADAWMRQQEIQRPDRWTAMIAPGFPND